MALPDSALSELARGVPHRRGHRLHPASVCRVAMQELIDAEAAAAIGAGRYERTETHG